MIVTHKPIPLYMQLATRWTILWTARGMQIARKGDWIVTAPTGCTWRIRKKHHKFYNTKDTSIRQLARERHANKKKSN